MTDVQAQLLAGLLRSKLQRPDGLRALLTDGLNALAPRERAAALDILRDILTANSVPTP